MCEWLHGPQRENIHTGVSSKSPPEFRGMVKFSFVVPISMAAGKPLNMCTKLRNSPLGARIATCRVGCGRPSSPRATRAPQTTPATRTTRATCGRRDTLLSMVAISIALQTRQSVASAEEVYLESPTVTDQVYLDVGICPDGYKKDRRLGDATILCAEPEPMGTIVIDLFGEVAPDSVYNFKELVRSGALVGTVVNRCFGRSYIVAGQQGAHRNGLLEVGSRDLVGNLDLRKNGDLLNSSSFKLRHVRPGTVSLNLSKNLDEDFYRNRPGYTELGIIITTGPAPVPTLDEENIVFGRVSKGMDVVTRISEVPTFKENKSLQVFTDLATVLGDDRVQKKQAVYGRPMTPVLFTQTGIVGV